LSKDQNIFVAVQPWNKNGDEPGHWTLDFFDTRTGQRIGSSLRLTNNVGFGEVEAQHNCIWGYPTPRFSRDGKTVHFDSISSNGHLSFQVPTHQCNVSSGDQLNPGRIWQDRTGLFREDPCQAWKYCGWTVDSQDNKDTMIRRVGESVPTYEIDSAQYHFCGLNNDYLFVASRTEAQSQTSIEQFARQHLGWLFGPNRPYAIQIIDLNSRREVARIPCEQQYELPAISDNGQFIACEGTIYRLPPDRNWRAILGIPSVLVLVLILPAVIIVARARKQ
jgi:hypothetical protein